MKPSFIVAACCLGAAYLALAQPEKPTREPSRLLPDRTRLPQPSQPAQEGTRQPAPPSVNSETTVPSMHLRYQVEIAGVTGEIFTPTFFSPIRTSFDVVEYRDTNSTRVSHRPGVMRTDVFVLGGPLPAEESIVRWYKTVSDGLLDRRAGSIIIMDSTGTEIQRFNFYEAWPCGFSVDPFTQTWKVEISFDLMEKA